MTPTTKDSYQHFMPFIATGLPKDLLRYCFEDLELTAPEVENLLSDTRQLAKAITILSPVYSGEILPKSAHIALYVIDGSLDLIQRSRDSCNGVR